MNSTQSLVFPNEFAETQGMNDKERAKYNQEQLHTYYKQISPYFFKQFEGETSPDVRTYPIGLYAMAQTLSVFFRDTIHLAASGLNRTTYQEPILLFGFEQDKLGAFAPLVYSPVPQEKIWAYLWLAFPSEKKLVRLMANNEDPNIFLAEVYNNYDSSSKRAYFSDEPDQELTSFIISTRSMSDFAAACFIATKVFAHKISFEDYPSMFEAVLH